MGISLKRKTTFLIIPTYQGPGINNMMEEAHSSARFRMGVFCDVLSSGDLTFEPLKSKHGIELLKQPKTPSDPLSNSADKTSTILLSSFKEKFQNWRSATDSERSSAEATGTKLPSRVPARTSSASASSQNPEFRRNFSNSAKSWSASAVDVLQGNSSKDTDTDESNCAEFQVEKVGGFLRETSLGMNALAEGEEIDGSELFGVVRNNAAANGKGARREGGDEKSAEDKTSSSESEDDGEATLDDIMSSRKSKQGKAEWNHQWDRYKVGVAVAISIGAAAWGLWKLRARMKRKRMLR